MPARSHRHRSSPCTNDIDPLVQSRYPTMATHGNLLILFPFSIPVLANRGLIFQHVCTSVLVPCTLQLVRIDFRHLRKMIRHQSHFGTSWQVDQDAKLHCRYTTHGHGLRDCVGVPKWWRFSSHLDVCDERRKSPSQALATGVFLGARRGFLLLHRIDSGCPEDGFSESLADQCYLIADGLTYMQM